MGRAAATRDGDVSMKKVLAGLAILFVVFFVFTQPQAAADVVKATFELVSNVFDTVIEFLNALFS
jgi:hypothetical protein